MEINQIPKSGYIYAVSDELFLSPYSLHEDRIMLPSGEEFSLEVWTEIHLFDEKTECRILKKGGDAESSFFVLTESEENDHDWVIIREKQWLKPEFCQEGGTRLLVVNRFEYNFDDRLCLTEYRLAGITE